MDKVLELTTRIIENNPHKEKSDEYMNWIFDLDEYNSLSSMRRDEVVFRLDIELANKKIYIN